MFLRWVLVVDQVCKVGDNENEVGKCG